MSDNIDHTAEQIKESAVAIKVAKVWEDDSLKKNAYETIKELADQKIRELTDQHPEGALEDDLEEAIYRAKDAGVHEEEIKRMMEDAIDIHTEVEN